MPTGFGVVDSIIAAKKAYDEKDLRTCLFHTLAAVAATSRKRFPERQRGQSGYKGDRDAFTEFIGNDLGSNFPGNIQIVGAIRAQFRNQMRSLPEILYDLRNDLFHEAEIKDIDFVWSDDLLIMPRPRLLLSSGLIMSLMRLVVRAPENSTLFPPSTHNTLFTS